MKNYIALAASTPQFKLQMHNYIRRKKTLTEALRSNIYITTKFQ